jgi:hypothetical protein
MINISKEEVQELHTCILYSQTFPENRAVYGTMWKIWKTQTGQR